MGTIAESNFSGKNGTHFKLSLDMSYSQDTTNNKTTITYTNYWVAMDGYSGSGSTVNAYINGGWVGSASSINMNETKNMGSQTIEVYHNNDGTFPNTGFSASINTPWTLGSASVSGTLTSSNIPTINRKSTFSMNKTTFNVGETIYAYITQYASSFHQNLYIRIGNSDVLVKQNASGTVTINTNDYANAIYSATPTSKYHDNYFKLVTYDSNNNYIGENTINYRVNIVNSNPTFDIAYQDTNASTISITGNNQKIIQNNSTLQFNFTNCSAKNGASLSSYSININGTIASGSNSSASFNKNWGTLNLSNNTNASVTIIDSRGFTTTKTVALTILEWKLPTAIITLNRQQNYYTETDITADATYSSLDNSNTLTIQYRIKKTTSQTWGTYATLTDNVTTTFNADNQYSWDIQVKLTDLIGTNTYNLTIGVGTPIFFIDRQKHSLGLNCFPQNNNSLELNGTDVMSSINTISNNITTINNSITTINGNITSLQKLQQYSGNEIAIGTWIDGKTLYRKVFNVGSIQSNTVTINHGISNLDWVVQMYGTAKMNNTWYSLDRVSTLANNQQVGMSVSGSQLIVTAGSDANFTQGCYIVVEYTKSS